MIHFIRNCKNKKKYEGLFVLFFYENEKKIQIRCELEHEEHFKVQN